MPKEPSTRASLWTLLLHRWIRRGGLMKRKDSSRTPQRNAYCGDIARVVAEGCHVAAHHQSENHLTKLIERMKDVRDGDQAVARIVQQLQRSGGNNLATRRCGHGHASEAEGVFVKRCPHVCH